MVLAAAGPSQGAQNCTPTRLLKGEETANPEWLSSRTSALPAPTHASPRPPCTHTSSWEGTHHSLAASISRNRPLQPAPSSGKRPGTELATALRVTASAPARRRACNESLGKLILCACACACTCVQTPLCSAFLVTELLAFTTTTANHLQRSPSQIVVTGRLPPQALRRHGQGRYKGMGKAQRPKLGSSPP